MTAPALLSPAEASPTYVLPAVLALLPAAERWVTYLITGLDKTRHMAVALTVLGMSFVLAVPGPFPTLVDGVLPRANISSLLSQLATIAGLMAALALADERPPSRTRRIARFTGTMTFMAVLTAIFFSCAPTYHAELTTAAFGQIPSLQMYFTLYLLFFIIVVPVIARRMIRRPDHYRGRYVLAGRILASAHALFWSFVLLRLVDLYTHDAIDHFISYPIPLLTMSAVITIVGSLYPAVGAWLAGRRRRRTLHEVWSHVTAHAPHVRAHRSRATDYRALIEVQDAIAHLSAYGAPLTPLMRSIAAIPQRSVDDIDGMFDDLANCLRDVQAAPEPEDAATR